MTRIFWVSATLAIAADQLSKWLVVHAMDVLAEAGATAIIQPGGSMRDAEVIQAADQAGLAMVFTAMRHFRH